MSVSRRRSRWLHSHTLKTKLKLGKRILSFGTQLRALDRGLWSETPYWISALFSSVKIDWLSCFPCFFPPDDRQVRNQLYVFYLTELLSQLSSVIETPSLDATDLNTGTWCGKAAADLRTVWKNRCSTTFCYKLLPISLRLATVTIG